MPASLRLFPHERVLLPRTKLAYVHLRNLLTDAKRDRAARVFGYVAIWLPEELLLLYLQEGELVNATTTDGREARALPLAEAVGRVPTEPELGEICFHEADDEQLACMYQALLTAPEPWPAELDVRDPMSVFPYLMGTVFDGVVEIQVDGAVNYLIFRDGTVQRAYLAVPEKRPLVERVQALFADARRSGFNVRRWPVPPPLPAQAPPALVQAYRELVHALVRRLSERGRESAAAIAEHARQGLLERHPVLGSFAAAGRPPHDPVTDTATLTAAVAAWVSEVMWTAADHDTGSPQELLRELTRERRHMFQSAGFFDRLSGALQ